MNNRIIINSRETGKTTFLLNEIDKYIESGKNVIILDSATEHEDKSLLKKVTSKYANCITYDIRDINKIVLSNETNALYIKNFRDFFPYKDIINNLGKIICFDLSYFLEKGHDVYDKTNDENLYKYYRKLYNFLAQQIVLSLILCERYGILKNYVVVMDEIEFPKTDYDISILQENLEFLASVHPENSFGTFYNSFNEIDFKPYVKRRKND